MSYINITCASTKPVEYYVDSNWVQSDETTFLKKHVLARGAYLLLTPASFITSALDTIIGLGAGIGAICTLGKHKPTYVFAGRHVFMSNFSCALPYQNFLQTINPEAKFGDTRGFIVSSIVKPLTNIAASCQKSNNFLKRHIASRLTYALSAIACLVTRAVDGVISIPITALSILTVGKFQSINNLAYKTLKASGIVNDLFQLTMLFINPWAATSEA